jgi:hypothetical protein
MFIETPDSMTEEMQTKWIKHWQVIYPKTKIDNAEWFAVDNPIWLNEEREFSISANKY